MKENPNQCPKTPISFSVGPTKLATLLKLKKSVQAKKQEAEQ